MEESPYCTGLGAITEKGINRKHNIMWSLCKRAFFWTKSKYLHAIEVVDIDQATYPDCKQSYF